MKKRLFIMDADVLSTAEVRRKLSNSPSVEICGEAAGINGIWQALQDANPDILLVGSLEETEFGVICQQIRLAFPHLAFIAACTAQELLWEPFLRNLGIWVIAKPIHPVQLETLALQSSVLQNMHSPRVAEARMDPAYVAVTQPKHFITVYGPKGGVGKTFLSRELAIYFSQRKQSGRQFQVLAVDFNLDLGTFATSLNLSRTPNLYNWVQAIDARLTEMAVKDGKNPVLLLQEDWQEYAARIPLAPQEVDNHVVIHAETGLHVLTSPREIHQSFEIHDYHLYVILETLKQSKYDVILIDTAPDTTDATIQALFFADHVVMVGNPVVDAIENIQRMLKLLREAEYPEEKIQICMNRLQRKELFTLEEIRAYFQLHPSKKIFPVPDDGEVKRSINTGTPVMLFPGRNAAKDAIEALGKSLLGLEQDTEQKQEKAKQRPSLFRWLRK